jgi:hypothetical protein
MSPPSAASDPAIEPETTSTRSRIALSNGPVHPVPEALVPALAPAAHVVHEWVAYTVTCEDAVGIEVGSGLAETIVSGVFRVRFENQLGLSRMRAFDADGHIIASRHVSLFDVTKIDADVVS